MVYAYPPARSKMAQSDGGAAAMKRRKTMLNADTGVGAEMEAKLLELNKEDNKSFHTDSGDEQPAPSKPAVAKPAPAKVAAKKEEPKTKVEAPTPAANAKVNEADGKAVVLGADGKPVEVVKAGGSACCTTF